MSKVWGGGGAVTIILNGFFSLLSLLGLLGLLDLGSFGFLDFFYLSELYVF